MTEVFYFQYMKRALLISFLVMVLMILAMRWQGHSLVTPVSPRGIVDLEFARTQARLDQLRLFWNFGDILINIWLDFVFIAAYTWFFINGCRFVKHYLKLETWSDRFISIAIAAAFFDVCENFLMLLILNGSFSTSILPVVFYCALLKFILAGLVVLFLMLTLPVALLYKKRRIIP